MNDLVKQLREIPSIIKQQHSKVLTHISSVESLKQKVQQLEDGLRIKVSEDKNLKNESIRQSVLNLALKDDEHYHTFLAELQLEQAELNNAKLELEFLENFFSACKSIARIEGVRE